MRWMVAVALVCGCGAELPVGPGEARALHYDYSIDLRTREARAEVSLEMTFPGDCIDIPVRAADLSEVTLDGEPASGQLAGGVLTACGRGWDEGDPLTLVAETTVLEETWGESQVGFSVTEDGEGAPFSYLVSWVGGCDRFAPCQSEPDRFATYRFEVAHDPGTRVLCPGRVT